MNEDCKKNYGLLNDLRQLHNEYLSAYKSAIDMAEAAPSNRDAVFDECQKLKVSFQKVLSQLREVYPRLNKEQIKQLGILQARFHLNPVRHKDIWIAPEEKGGADAVWRIIASRLRKKPGLVDSLIKMEKTDGQPDAIWYDAASDEYYFVDCSHRSPEGRKKLPYDREAQIKNERMGRETKGNTVDMAKEMGIELLTEGQYRTLTKTIEMDHITWTWLATPTDVRETGFAKYGKTSREVIVAIQDAALKSSLGGFRGLLRV